MKRSVMIVLALALVFASAITALAEETGVFGGTFKAAMQANPPTLDPHRTTNTVTQQIVSHVFEPLVAFDRTFTPTPVLLDSWEVADDSMSYTLFLRQGVKFHNGKTMTAEDVKASLERIIRISPVSGYYAQVKGIEVIDDYTLRVDLTEPFNLIAAMTVQMTWQAIMPKEYAEIEDELTVGQLIGTGPYKLAEWTPDVHVKLVRFEDYEPVDAPPSGFVGKKVAYFDEILYIPVKELSARLAGLQTGEYDYAEALGIPMKKIIESDPNLNAHFVRPQWIPCWELNHTNPPMDNVKFRQALMAALDLDEVMRTVTLNDPEFYEVHPGFLFGPYSEWFSEVGAEYHNQGNIERARQLLEEAGYAGEEIVVLCNRDYDWMYRTTLAAVAQLERAGIKVVLEFYDWNSQIAKALSLEGWHINQSGKSLYEDPLRARGSLMSGAPYAYGYANADIDRILTELGKPASFEERKLLWQEAQEIYYEDVPVILFGDLYGLEATRASIKNYQSWYVVPIFWNIWRE
jgi:peptide/nickel transport system substrate-binding protein